MRLGLISMPVFASIGLLVIMQASVTVIAWAQLPAQNATSMSVIAGHVTINGRPAANVLIVLESFDWSELLGGNHSSAAIDASGKFEFKGLRPPQIKMAPTNLPGGY